MELTEFLLARIAEDEERGRSLVMQWHDVGNACQSCGTDGKRVLAECEARRRIVAEHSPVDPCDAHDANFQTVLCDTLRLLALPYADHADYDERWRP